MAVSVFDVIRESVLGFRPGAYVVASSPRIFAATREEMSRRIDALPPEVRAFVKGWGIPFLRDDGFALLGLSFVPGVPAGEKLTLYTCETELGEMLARDGEYAILDADGREIGALREGEKGSLSIVDSAGKMVGGVVVVDGIVHLWALAS